MEPNLRFMVLMLLVSLTAACVHWLVAKDKVRALGTFIFPLGIGAFILVALAIGQ